MPYIGRDLNRGNYLKLDDISSSFNGSTTTFNLTVGGSAFTPGSAFSILVSLGGVIQEPESAYQVENSEITFANAPTAQDSFFCIALGVALGIGVPGNGTVNGTQMAKPFSYDGFFHLDDSDNRVGIGSLTPKVSLDVVGNAEVSGILTATTINGSFIGSANNTSGISTFYDLKVSNNLTVEGTTTTLDTNLIGVDRIEVGANSNTVVGVAITQSGTADILKLYDDSTEVFSVADGGNVTITDSIIHSGDPDTKIRFHADDKFRIELGGLTNAFSGRKSTSGSAHAKFGINVATPQAALDINEGYNHQGILRVTNGNQGTGYYHQLEMSGTQNIFTLWKHYDGSSTNTTHIHGSTRHAWYIGGNEKVRVHSDGNVGIGTNNPLQKLHVYGSGNQLIMLQSTSASNAQLQLKTSQRTYNLENITGGTFQIRDGSVGSIRLSINSSGHTTFGGNLIIPDQIIHDGDPDTAIRFPAADTIRFEVGNQQAVHILPASAGSGGARMGLGTNNPTGMLHIYGANPPVRIQNSNDNANLQFGMWDTANIMFQASNRTFKFATETSNHITFFTGGLANVNERCRITSNGKFGVGDTDPVVKFHVKDSGVSHGGLNAHVSIEDTTSLAANVGGLQVFEGIYDSSGNSAIYAAVHGGKENASGGDYAGYLRFFTRASGALPVERVRILSNGNIGINTTTAPHKLSVKGTISMISGASGTQIVNLSSSSNNGYIMVNDSTGTTRARLDSSGSSYVRGGNFGVGVVSPTRSFHVKGMASGNSTNRMAIFESTGTAGSFIAFQDANTTDDSKCRIGSIGGNNIGIRGDSHSFQDGGGNNKMVIHSTGYVGINDTTANARLIIKGNSDDGDNDCQLRIYDMDTTTGSQIPSLSFWGGSTQLAYIRGTSSGLRFYTGSSGSMAFSAAFDNNQRFLLGNDSNIQVDSSNPRLQVIGTSDSTAHLSIGNFSASVTPPTLSLVKSRGGIGAYTAVQDDDVLGKINFIGADGTDLAEVSGKILVACDAAVAGNRVPSRMEFYNTDGAGNLDLNMVLTRDSQLFLTSGITRDAMHSLAHNTANDFVLGRTTGNADTGMTLVTPSATSGFINFADADGSRQGAIVYKHGSGEDKMYFRTNNNQTAMVLDSSQNVGLGVDPPQTKLNVIGTISTGRNVAREFGTIINVSSEHHSSRAGSNVINGNKNYEYGMDWLAAGGSRTDANLTIDLGSARTCDRFVIYNQNEYSGSHREVKRFTLEGSNDNSNWTTILDDNAGCSNGHEPNPGWSFRIPADRKDDEEGKSYRYWRFTMKDFHGSDSYGGIMELELYEVGNISAGGNSNGVGSEITTSSLVATDVSAEIVRANGQPAFSVARSATQPSSGDFGANQTIIFDDDSSGGFFQTGTSPHAQYYNTSNGLFTAPMSGIYFFTTTVLVQNATNNYDLIIKTTARDFYCAPGRKAANAGSTSWSTSGIVYLAFGGEVITYMKKGETAEVRFTTFGGGQIYGSGTWTRFAGYLLG